MEIYITAVFLISMIGLLIVKRKAKKDIELLEEDVKKLESHVKDLSEKLKRYEENR